MFYIQQDDKIVLFDEDKQKLQDTIAFMPQYQGLEIKEVQEGYVIYNLELMTVEEMEEKQIQERKQTFYTHFIKTSLGNYRLEPKGYANAQQAMDVTNTMATALGGLTEQLVPLVIFYETPDFSKAEECTEEWLVAHQKNPSIMTLEEWQKFYFEFCQLYAMQQYKTTA